MKYVSKNSNVIIFEADLLNIRGGSYSSGWGKVLLIVIGAWSSIKKGLHDGFFDGIE